METPEQCKIFQNDIVLVSSEMIWKYGILNINSALQICFDFFFIPEFCIISNLTISHKKSWYN